MKHPARVVLGVCACAVAALAAGERPYGHRDFRPTPERPIGWRGDGSGVFPGARPPLEWDDPAVPHPLGDYGAAVDEDFKEGGPDGADAQTQSPATLGSNILWKVKLPDFGHGAPIAVGDRVFVTADRDRLLCLSAEDGRVLWQDYPHLDDQRSNWGGMLGRSMPTPCSDGRYVYTKCTTGALICYDLNGVKKWTFPLANDISELGVPSPVLVDGKVIVKERLGGRVVAVDAETGRSAWTVDLAAFKKPTDRLESNFDGYAVMRVNGRALLVDSAGHVLDAATGAVVARDLAHHDERVDTWNGMMNCSLPGQDGVNLFAHMWRWAGFKGGHTATYLNGSTRLYAYRFEPQADGKSVRAVPLWENNRDFWGTARGATIVGDRCYWVSKNMDEMTVIDLKSGDSRTFAWLFGQWRHTSLYGGPPYGWIYPHSVSDGYFLFHQGGSGLTAVALLAPVPRLLAINKTEGGVGGPTLHGDRIYIHSRNLLYCVADREAEATRPRFDEADRLSEEGQTDRSLAVFAELAGHPSRHIRCHAVRRMIERHGARAVPAVSAALADTHDWVHWIAVEAARRLPNTALATAIAAVLPSATPAARASLLQTLAVRGEFLAPDLLIASLGDDADAVREAALAAAQAVGSATVARAIVARYPASDGWERPRLFAALAAMPGPEVDAELAAALGGGSPAVRRDAALLLGRRRATKHATDLLALRRDPDVVTRRSAIRALREMAAPDDPTPLLDWLVAAPDWREEDELLAGIAENARRRDDAPALAEGVRAAWSTVTAERKRRLLVRVLAARHAPATLAALKGLLATDLQTEVKVALAEELAAWTSADARPTLAELHKAANPQRVRFAAYVGYVRNVSIFEKALEARLDLLAKAVASAPRPDDRRFVFEECARLGDVRALGLISGAMAKDMGGPHAVAAVTQLAPLTLEKAYAKTMACMEEALSGVELSREANAETRATLQTALKASLSQLQRLAAEKKLVTIETKAADPDLDL